jgi:hypothetical protein
MPCFTQAAPTATAEDWWEEMRSITFAPDFKIDDLMKTAYGRIAGSLLKGTRFPNRRVILRSLKSNEAWAEKHAPSLVIEEIVRPLQLVQQTSTEISNPLAEPTHIRKHLAEWLPPTLRETKLDLIYSSNEHGATLDSFYTKVSKIKRTIMLIEVEKTGDVIGMFASWAWHVDTKTYGDGNSFLFRASPNENAAVYKWHPPSNQADLMETDIEQAALWEQFMVGGREFISAGANKDGTCGLRINEDLSKGSSYSALGFDNDPLAGDKLTEFDITRVEVYRFIRALDGVPLDKVDEVWQW